MQEAIQAWLQKSPSRHTRKSYQQDLRQFLEFNDIDAEQVERLTTIRPKHVSAWRDSLKEQGSSNATIRRKMTVIRALFSYLQVYGYVGANPAHGKFVTAPSAPRDGKTVGLSPQACRQLLDAPSETNPAGLRDRAIIAVLAYSACRVGELVKLKVADVRSNGQHQILSISGKGDRERIVPLHWEAVDRLSQWVEVSGIAVDRNGPLFRPSQSARGRGNDGFRRSCMTTRAIANLIRKYVRHQQLDIAVSVHSLRVTALTTARERGADIIDLQDFAGHSDPRTTLTYIRSRDRLSQSPTYILKY
jgi:integrase/recombinase XerD